MENPDYRLGKLINVATRPNTPHPTTFYIEDDKMLNELKSIGTKNKNQNSQDSKIPDWKRILTYEELKPEDVSIELIQDMLSIIKKI
jgi:hypothetical protein